MQGRGGNRKFRNAKVVLVTREALDGRTLAAQLFDNLACQIQTDLGGKSELTAIELSLIEAFTGSTVMLQNLNARMLQGEQIDPIEHSAIVSSMVRTGSRLGLRRRSRDVNPSLSDYLVRGNANGNGHSDEVAFEGDG